MTEIPEAQIDKPNPVCLDGKKWLKQSKLEEEMAGMFKLVKNTAGNWASTASRNFQ
jgi:hypothetical protein